MNIGSLFSGYGGLDLAVRVLFHDAEPAWFVEHDLAPSKILKHHYPDTPNFGDVTTINWDQIAKTHPVDVITGGYPCQPFSTAGKRKGTQDERHLWPHVRQAIRVLRPKLTFLENVAGHRSLGLDRVLGDITEDGLCARWTTIRASDIGAPHDRERLFILIAPNPDSFRLEAERLSSRQGTQVTRDNDGIGSHAYHGSLQLDGKHRWLIDIKKEIGELAHTPGRWADSNKLWEQWERLTRPAPEPTETIDRDPTTKWRQDDWEAWGFEGGKPISTEIAESAQQSLRCEFHQINTEFVEWMMGLPHGWVTNPVIGLTRAQQLKALGNGVVPQQAEQALKLLLKMEVMT